MITPIYRVKAIESLIQQFNADCPHAQSMKPVVTQLRNSVAALGTLFERPNPTDTVAMQQKRVATASTKVAAQAKSTNDALNQLIGKAHGDVQARIDAKLNLKENSFAPEIRASFRAMSRAERIAMLKKLADENRGPEAASILKAPAILTGVSEDEQKQYIAYMEKKHAPAEVAEHQAIAKAVSTAMSAVNVALDTAADFANPNRLAEIEAREREAAEAEAAFNATANQQLS